MPESATKRSKLGYMERRVPSPNRYMAFAKFCFCKNNKRTIVVGKANPKDKGEQCSVNTADASSRVSIRSPKMTVNTMKEHHEEGTSQELEAGGNGEMCQHAQIILTWSDGYIMTPS